MALKRAPSMATDYSVIAEMTKAISDAEDRDDVRAAAADQLAGEAGDQGADQRCQRHHQQHVLGEFCGHG